MSRASCRLVVSGVLLLFFGLAAPAQESQKARLRILLPSADVQLEIQGVPQKKKEGVEVRLFESPALEPGKNYVYDIKATWTENGKPVVRERSVKVMAGKTAEVDLRAADERSPGTAPAKPPIPEKSTPEKPKPSQPPAPEKPMTEKPVAPSPPDNSVTPAEVVEYMLPIAKIVESDVVLVLGCGDGRIATMAAAKYHPRKAIGVDSHPSTLTTARKNAEAGKVADRVEFRLGDPAKIADKDLAEATVVFIDNFLPKQLAELAPALKKLKPGTRIIVHNFEVPGMKFTDKREIIVSEIQYAVYIYELK